MKKLIFRQTESIFRFLLFISLSILLLPVFLGAQQTGGEYRGFWVDTFNSSLNNHDDILAVVNNAKLSKANALFAQIRRRGDAWYLNSLEPPPDGITFPAGFDPLADLIQTAHAEGIEVHAYVIMSAVWNKNPTVTGGLPTSPNHVFNQHGGFNQMTGQIETGPNNWLTRTLLPDGSGITFQGHRFGADFWVDFGHPEAAAYTVNVLMQLVNNYDIDGLHLDRIRYPELAVAGQTPSTGANIGYNPRSVERFQIRNNIPSGSPPPSPGDAAWAQWRRDQVTNVVRRVYLNAIAAKPQLKISASLIAFGGGPTTEAAWNSAETYWRVYQDWRAWTEEGILDIAVPMNYKREHTPSNVPLFDTWNEWTKNHQYNRAALLGLGVYLNAIEGTLRQTRRSFAPSATGQTVKGVVFYSMANTNEAVTANPFSIPPGQNTPRRPLAEFASGLTTGKSVDGLTFYEDQIVNPVPIFAQTASVPVFPWKSAPTKGYLKGFARRADATPLDAATVTIRNLGTDATRTTGADGGGFYGGVDLTPGQYLVKAVLGSETLYSCATNVTAGSVATADLQTETTAPTTSAALDPPAPNGANGWYKSDVALNLTAADDCAGVASTEYSLDGGASWLPYAQSVLIGNEGTTNISYRSTDRAGNVETAGSVVVKIDKTAPTIKLTAVARPMFPQNRQTVRISINGTGGDAVSGLSTVSYVITDNRGITYSVPTRILTGNASQWTDEFSGEIGRRSGDRIFQIAATITDAAGNLSTAATSVTVSPNLTTP